MALLTLLALACGLAVPAGATTVEHRAAAATLTFSPDAPVAGGTGTFRAKVPTSGRRKVKLQQSVSGSWKVIDGKRTSRKGVASFAITVRAKKTTYRVVAPATSSLRAATTNQVTVTPAAPEEVDGTLREVGIGEYPSISGDGGELAWLGFDEELFYAARFYDADTDTGTVVDAPAAEGVVVSGDGTSVLFRKGGQGFWDESWGLREWQAGQPRGGGSLLWEESADGEYPWTLFYAGGLSANGYGSFVASGSDDDVPTLYLLRPDRTWTKIVNTDWVTSEIAPDGSCVSFESTKGLVPADDNKVVDAYVWLRASDTFVLVSRDANGDPLPGASGKASVSDDCRYVSYEREGKFGQWEVHLWDRTTDQRRLISKGLDGVSSGDNSFSSISADGSQVVFESTASLTSEKDQGNYDVYLWSRGTDALSLLTPKASVGAGLHPEISDDGRHVTFDGAPNNCQSPCDRRVYLWDRTD